MPLVLWKVEKQILKIPEQAWSYWPAGSLEGQVCIPQTEVQLPHGLTLASFGLSKGWTFPNHN